MSINYMYVYVKHNYLFQHNNEENVSKISQWCVQCSNKLETTNIQKYIINSLTQAIGPNNKSGRRGSRYVYSM